MIATHKENGKEVPNAEKESVCHKKNWWMPYGCGLWGRYTEQFHFKNGVTTVHKDLS